MDYDANPIQVFSQYSYEQMKGFQRFHYRKMRRNSIILLCLTAPWFAASIVLGIIASVSAPDSDAYFPPYVFIGPIIFWLAIFVSPLLVFCGVFYTRKAHANASKLVQNGQRYNFCNSDLAYSSEQQDSMWQGRTAYSAILNVWETRDMFYLYIAKNQAYLIDKRGFESGSPDELRALLKMHVPGNKYRQYKV